MADLICSSESPVSVKIGTLGSAGFKGVENLF